MSESSSSKTEDRKLSEIVAQAFISSLSFEYRTPLSSIVGFSQLLLTEKPGPLNDQQIEMLTNIHQTASYLVDSINQLLEMQQAANGQLLLEFELVDIQTVIQTISPNYIVLDIPSSLPKIEADKKRIEKIIETLLNEFVHLSDSSEDGQVLIQADAGNTDLIIRILAKNKKTAQFWEGNPDLVYSNAVIEQHGGYLKVEQTNSTLEIIISLPITQPQMAD